MRREPAGSGTVRVDGHDIVKEKAEASKSIGWVPEFPNFDQSAKAESLMMYFAGFRGISEEDAERRTRDLFEQLRLVGL